MTQEMEQFETHMDKMERLAQQQRHELALAQEKTKQVKIESKKDTKETFMFSFGMLIAGAVVIAIIAAFFFGVRGPSAEEQNRQQEINLCYENNGEWVPESNTGEGGVVLVAEHCDIPGQDNTEDD